MPSKTGITAVGRRKSASARVRLLPLAEDAEAFIKVNGREFANYFPQELRQQLIMQPLELTERKDQYNIVVRVNGGGSNGQAGAVLHGLARALEKEDPSLRPVLKEAGFLTRDPRAVERKKPGRHKARKKPQFSKR